MIAAQSLRPATQVKISLIMLHQQPYIELGVSNRCIITNNQYSNKA
jgi:hypothetical protein